MWPRTAVPTLAQICGKHGSAAGTAGPTLGLWPPLARRSSATGSRRSPAATAAVLVAIGVVTVLPGGDPFVRARAAPQRGARDAPAPVGRGGLARMPAARPVRGVAEPRRTTRGRGRRGCGRGRGGPAGMGQLDRAPLPPCARRFSPLLRSPLPGSPRSCRGGPKPRRGPLSELAAWLLALARGGRARARVRPVRGSLVQPGVPVRRRAGGGRRVDRRRAHRGGTPGAGGRRGRDWPASSSADPRRRRFAGRVGASLAAVGILVGTELLLRDTETWARTTSAWLPWTLGPPALVICVIGFRAAAMRRAVDGLLRDLEGGRAGRGPLRRPRRGAVGRRLWARRAAETRQRCVVLRDEHGPAVRLVAAPGGEAIGRIVALACTWRSRTPG